MLHNDKELFEQIVLKTADDMGIEVGIVEKDYFVTMFLRHIVQRQPDIIFKGGTSLSKCYGLIQRFSEDIDLNIEGDAKPTEGQRRRLKENIVAAIDECSFVLTNPEEIRSRRDFNKYVVDYPTVFDASYLKRHLIVETAVYLRAYPSKRMKAGSYVYDYLLKNHLDELIAEHNITPFELNVQAAERTFVDKVFALGDYYLSGAIQEHSRHIYDLYKLLGVVELDDSMRDLAMVVAEERKPHKTCLSVQDGVSMQQLLKEIIQQDVYKADYEGKTSSLLFETVPYTEAITALKTIADSGIFR